MKYSLEIRAAEGGEDSKLFVKDLAQAYVKFLDRKGWLNRVSCDVPGTLCITVEGQDLSLLDNEPGGHRIQRIPPTEKRGRVHTSTVTVAVIDLSRKADQAYFKRSESDFRLEWYSGTGAGGQHRNKHQNSARITHLPTGLVETAQCRSRENSKQEAMKRLTERLDGIAHHGLSSEIAIDRKAQVGSGQRGDKVRTYRFQDDTVSDGRTGKKVKLSKVMNGFFELLQ